MPDEIQGGEVAPVVEVQIAETPAVETEVKPESAQEPAESQASDTESEAGEKEPPAEKTFTQAELNEILEKKTAKLARQRDQERQKREHIEREVAKASIPQDEGKPDISHFSDAEEYANAVADWKLGLRDRQEQVAQQHKVASSFEQKASDFLADFSEMDGVDMDKWSTQVQISDSMARAIVESDVGTKVAHHLYNHPEESRRIAGLSVERQAAEIGKLEARLSSAPQISKAPAPITPIGKGNATTSRRPEDMPMDEYIAYRKKQGNTRY